MSQNIPLLWIFVHLFKNVKTIFRSRAIQKRQRLPVARAAVGQLLIILTNVQEMVPQAASRPQITSIWLWNILCNFLNSMLIFLVALIPVQ